MPDSYELTHGLDPRVAANGEDSDDDGYSDYHEFRLGTLPDDDASVPGYLGDHAESFESGLDSSWFDTDGGPMEWEIVSTDSTDGVNSLSNKTNPDNRFQWIHRIVNLRPSVSSLDVRLDDVNCSAYFVIYDTTDNIYTNRCGDPGAPWETRPDAINPDLSGYPFIGAGLLEEGVHEFMIRVDTSTTGHVFMDNWIIDEVAGP